MNASDKPALIRKLSKRHAKAACALSDAIAGYAELGFQETRSADAMKTFLETRGFQVAFPWPHLPTAFKATRGEGKPDFALLAEYDALPNCGLKPGETGHGCGHNLLGAAAAMAAVVAAEALQQTARPGRITLWGCPAEELLAGKVYMARNGAFRGHDAVFAWHPSVRSGVHHPGGAAMDSVRYAFTGRTAHGSSAHNGRSALDAVILLDVAANYLREHVPDNVRIHMCIPEGGDAPNVVPAHATGWYYVRGRDRAQVDAIRKRLDACAKGAAMATETRLRITRDTGGYHRLRNEALSHVILDNLKAFGPPKVLSSDRKRLRDLGLPDRINTTLDERLHTVAGKASSDEDNVSWLSPLGRMNLVTRSCDATGHHRDTTAQVTLPLAHRGLQRAAEVLAGSILDLAADPKRRAVVMAEFRKGTRGFHYDPLVPIKPPSLRPTASGAPGLPDDAV